MPNEKSAIDFTHQTKYKVGTVTYKITAHYEKDADPIKHKIQNLIKKDIENDDLQRGLSQSKVV